MGRKAHFADGSADTFSAVVWATGYQRGLEWLDVPVFDERGQVVHARGVGNVPDVSFLGLSWQHTRSSALLGGVGRDAAYITDHLLERPRHLPRDGGHVERQVSS